MKNPVWLFDLDNTLHNASPHIFPHINRAMREYIECHLGVDEHEATRIRQDYWERYGATLLGLMRHHGTDPRHFLHETHQFPDLARMVVFEKPHSMSCVATVVTVPAPPAPLTTWTTSRLAGAPQESGGGVS